MSGAKTERGNYGTPAAAPERGEQPYSGSGMTEDEAQRALDEGDNQKIDRMLDELDISTTATDGDQTAKPDTEWSNSSSKNLDEQDAPPAQE
ncbi:hypothetical protein [Paraburkholderia sp. DHOC27]|uniref:hypothetical protein n=1 Tax=Paraburkholderia sp. DHOC27 TaxID=2303330 RepID=UPI00216B5B34|nr:hypothetical protein [Paraburkholderia sp. DHOC27]